MTLPQSQSFPTAADDLVSGENGPMRNRRVKIAR